jgi:hypothetical protein
MVDGADGVMRRRQVRRNSMKDERIPQRTAPPSTHARMPPEPPLGEPCIKFMIM